MNILHKIIQKGVAMKMPTMEEIEKADRIQICKWYRFVPSPETDTEVKSLNRIVARFDELGGMTPDISRLIDNERKEEHSAKD